MRHKNHPLIRSFRCSKYLNDALEFISRHTQRSTADVIREALSELIEKYKLTITKL